MKEGRYKSFGVEKFLLDRYFYNWVLFPNEESTAFWENYLKNASEEQKQDISKAIQILKSLEDERVTYSLTKKIQIWENIKNKGEEQKKTRFIRQVMKYAAILIAAVGLASVWFYSPFTKNNIYDDISLNKEQLKSEKTTLLLASGEEITLDSDNSEVSYNSDGEKVSINNKKELNQNLELQNEVMNEIIVPYGKRTKLTLSDGTQVWVNSGSKLVYPATFIGSKRKVALVGEAYFDVAKDEEMPFIVNTENQKIRVTGTSFNVTAYPDETNENTVLVEGAVTIKMRNNRFAKQIPLKPNQMAQVENNACRVEKVDIEDHIAWIDGMFIFDNAAFEVVLKRISRYYDIDIESFVSSESLFIKGKLDLKDNYENVLDALTVIAPVTYYESNNTIVFESTN